MAVGQRLKVADLFRKVRIEAALVVRSYDHKKAEPDAHAMQVPTDLTEATTLGGALSICAA
jgi:hypothetical protein